MTPKTILITGGLGFVGSYAAEAFLAEDWEVFLLDDRRGPVVDDVPGAKLIVGDVAAIGANWITRLDPDVVLHCASPVGPGALAQRPERSSVADEILKTSVPVAHACATIGAPLIYISTSEVYGLSGPCAEDDDCVVPAGHTPRLQYAVGKRAAEQIAATVVPSCAIVRPFNIAGARQDRAKGFVLPTFVEQALGGEPLTVFGDGSARRAFMDVRDLCELLLRIGGAMGRATSPVGPHVLNAGAPQNTTTIADLAGRVQDKVEHREGQTSPIVYVDGTEVHGPRWTEAAGYHKVPVIGAAQHLFGWEAVTDLDSLIDGVIADVASRRDTIAS